MSGVYAFYRYLPVICRTRERRFALERDHAMRDAITLRRTGRARWLLSKTDLSIKTAAGWAGVTCRERLRVAFLRYEGSAPTEYRCVGSYRQGVRVRSVTTGGKRGM